MTERDTLSTLIQDLWYNLKQAWSNALKLFILMGICRNVGGSRAGGRDITGWDGRMGGGVGVSKRNGHQICILTILVGAGQ